ALQGAGFERRGLTRKPDSEGALALARRGVDIVKGDLDDEATLRRALAGAWGGFGVQNAGEASGEREEAQGKRLATLAREAGVEHYVYTSVGSAHKRTGVPHFDNKWRIEETVRGLRFPSHVILRPVFFMENLLAPFSLQGSTLAWALGSATKLQMIAVDDIGWFGARARSSPIGHAATRDQMGRLKESSHESCQIVGIRWAVGVRRCTGAGDRTRRDLGEDQEHRRQSSGSC